jgi:hypothetical protein
MQSLNLSSFLSMFQMVLSIKVNTPEDHSIDFVVADTKAWPADSCFISRSNLNECWVRHRFVQDPRLCESQRAVSCG